MKGRHYHGDFSGKFRRCRSCETGKKQVDLTQETLIYFQERQKIFFHFIRFHPEMFKNIYDYLTLLFYNCPEYSRNICLVLLLNSRAPSQINFANLSRVPEKATKYYYVYCFDNFFLDIYFTCGVVIILISFTFPLRLSPVGLKCMVAHYIYSRRGGSTSFTCHKFKKGTQIHV